MPTSKLLIVEDDRGLRDLLREEMEESGHDVHTVRSAEDGFRWLESQGVDLVISDLRLPGDSGMDLLERSRQLDRAPAFIVITGFGSIPQAVSALKAGADDFITKPIDLEHLALSVNRSLDTRRLRLQLKQFEALHGERSFRGMIGSSQPMQVLYEHVRQVARADGPVLLEGESGTGKELTARAIHDESNRSSNPFLAVNCAGVARELLESEFFGHEKGAFTGAQHSRKGLFQEADGGTLLLDEIGEMPPALQAKLLRVLQEGKVRPVGSSTMIDVNTRIIAATNRDLEKDVEEGKFRKDLFYRLETFTIEVPPLRERGEDIDLLAAHFLEHFSARMDKPIQGLSADAAEILRAYDYPGNVRELRNIVERSVTYCNGDEVTVDDLPKRMRKNLSASTRDDSPKFFPPDLLTEGDLPSIEQIEQRYINYVMERVEGNKSKAADVLGIGRRTLYRKLEDGAE